MHGRQSSFSVTTVHHAEMNDFAVIFYRLMMKFRFGYITWGFSLGNFLNLIPVFLSQNNKIPTYPIFNFLILPKLV